MINSGWDLYLNSRFRKNASTKTPPCSFGELRLAKPALSLNWESGKFVPKMRSILQNKAAFHANNAGIMKKKGICLAWATKWSDKIMKNLSHRRFFDVSVTRSPLRHSAARKKFSCAAVSSPISRAYEFRFPLFEILLFSPLLNSL